MRPFAAIALIYTLVFPSVSFGADQVGSNQAALAGYAPRSSQSEREWEVKFRAIPDPANLRDYMRRLSARPHHVGSPYDKDNAEWILAHFKEWGLDAHIEQFDVLFPTPKVRLLEMIGPSKFTAKLEEPALAVDPTSNQKSEQLPTYNAYSIDGDVTGPLVFVNYGLPEDYEKLDRLGISVKGAIVIAKYYHSWRGVKPKVAAEHGAIGCLIYSEPKDDGYTRDNVFPDGPMAPDEWRGSLPIPYHVGPGPARVHLKVEFNWDLKPVNDVIAKIPGSVAPDEWIIRGNHHDAWVNGAEDPISGQAPLLEEARALGELLK